MKSPRKVENRLKRFTAFGMIDMCDTKHDSSHEVEITMNKDVMKGNNDIAARNRAMFSGKGIRVIDVMGSVGSGKTSLIKALCRKLKTKYRIKVIAGDITTDIDAKRISSEGVPVYQINTGGMCHLEADLIENAVKKMGIDDTDILFIENVGNLICPASFDLGETKRLVVISVTEGPFMVVKHPIMFKDASVVVINKTDLSEAMGVEPDSFEPQVHTIQPKAKVVTLSLKNNDNVDNVIEALGF